MQLEVPTVHGRKKLNIPKGTQSGQTFSIKNEGVPSLRGHGRGDMFVETKINTPHDLTKRQVELLKEFREIERKKRGDTDAHEAGIFKKLFQV